MIENPTLYIIMREDIPDMNPGKGMAQAAHAQAQFEKYWLNYDVSRSNADFYDSVICWRHNIQSDGIYFGRTLVLTSPWEGMCDIETNVNHTGMVVDPTYPIRNYYGKAYTESVTTCMWAFPTTEEEIEYLKQFRLHP